MPLIQNYHGRVGATDTGSHNPNYADQLRRVVRDRLALVQGGLRHGVGRSSLWNGSIVPYSYIVSTLASNGK